MQANCMHMHTLSLRAHTMRTQTWLNPNQETNKQKNKAEMKILILATKHAQNIQ